MNHEEDKIIRNMYGAMIKADNYPEKLSPEFRKEITNILRQESKWGDSEQYQRVRDSVFLIASAAEENGFVKGFKYAFSLLRECAEV